MIKLPFVQRRRAMFTDIPEHTVECGECGAVFAVRAVKIKQSRVVCDGEALTLTYFVCPMCGKLYRIDLRDNRWYRLYDELEQARQRIERNWGKVSEDHIAKLQALAGAKLERLKQHNKYMQEKFAGEFTVANPQNGGTDTITYIP